MRMCSIVSCFSKRNPLNLARYLVNGGRKTSTMGFVTVEISPKWILWMVVYQLESRVSFSSLLFLAVLIYHSNLFLYFSQLKRKRYITYYVTCYCTTGSGHWQRNCFYLSLLENWKLSQRMINNSTKPSQGVNITPEYNSSKSKRSDLKWHFQISRESVYSKVGYKSLYSSRKRHFKKRIGPLCLSWSKHKQERSIAART